MTAKTVSIPISGVLRQVDVRLEVTGLRMARWRLWLAARLVWLAATVGGFNATLVLADEPAAPKVPPAPSHDAAGVPLRLSIDDPDFDWNSATALTIHLDGILQRDVLAFDREAGWIERYQRRGGELEVVGGSLVREVVWGRVEVVLRDEVPA